MNAAQDPVARFLESPAYGVVGASPRRFQMAGWLKARGGDDGSPTNGG